MSRVEGGIAIYEGDDVWANRDGVYSKYISLMEEQMAYYKSFESYYKYSIPYLKRCLEKAYAEKDHILSLVSLEEFIDNVKKQQDHPVETPVVWEKKVIASTGNSIPEGFITLNEALRQTLEPEKEIITWSI